MNILKPVPILVAVGIGLLLALSFGGTRLLSLRMGKQPDGGFIVATGQRIEPGSLDFNGRPIEIALHPDGQRFAVLNKSALLLGDRDGVKSDSPTPLGSSAGFRGLCWTPDGTRLYASTSAGHIQVCDFNRGKLIPGMRIQLKPESEKLNPVPGGMTFNREGTRLYVVAANRNAVVEVDTTTGTPLRELPVQNLPFEVRLTDDQKTLVVSNWGGRLPREGDRTAKSLDLDVVVDSRGALASGTVSLIDLESARTSHVEVGLHPTGLAISGTRAFVANAMSDSISEIDLATNTVTRTIPLTYQDQRLLGAMPNALAIHGSTLYAANGGDNALAVVDIDSCELLGYRPVGFFPTALAIASDGKSAYVLNTKGNGSVARTSIGQAGNAHDFQGTVTVVDLTSDLDRDTQVVARNNRWTARLEAPALKVYNQAIEHVIYIIKENRTYDEIFGDLPQGNGDATLCSLGELVMPNHRKLAREFTLFDNAYVSGTNSADGHAWSTQSIANEYLEHFYVGYSRTYPDDGSDAMALSTGGALWDAALAKNKTLRVYGEYCDDELNKVTPQPADWFEVWEDRQKKTGKFSFQAFTRIPSLKPHINPEYLYWPLWQSDQQRADIFINEFEKFSRDDRVPNLMILSLPCDHAEGTNPRYPTPRAMMADNDLALGRIVEAVTRSPQWQRTCIFVIEDDAQSGPDHVDGHRTSVLAISPYTRRGFVDSSFYTTIHLIRSIEHMLGLDPMNRFDALADPMTACFTDEPDLAPYAHVPANVPLDERNPSGPKMSDVDRYWLDRTLALDWSHIDAPDPYWLNRINWYSIHKGARPYPARPGDRPGLALDEDDDD